MSRSILLNALFIVAGFSSAAIQTLIYKLALVAIVLLLHTLWFRAVVRRAQNDVINHVDRHRHARASR